MSHIPDPGAPEERAASTSVGELIAEVSRDFSTLLRQEMELAKAELQQSAKRAGKGAGMFSGAGLAAHFTVLFLSIALWWGLGELVGNGWSAVIVAIIWGIVALVLFLKGKKEIEAVQGMPKTAESVKKIPDALKGNGER
ncbi:MAG: hypothetical protein JWP30_64 [Homoserinimonas sp.]|jgi:hypothetical protein|nr:hypothetical protein [Homoserinimonas sp.]